MPRPEWTEHFLAELARSPNVSSAARSVGISRRAAYLRRETDPDFAAAWDEALEQSTDALVGEMFRRGVYGTERPVFYQGEECGRIREFSDTLAIFLAKAHRPGVYADRPDSTPTGTIKVIIEHADAAAEARPAPPGPGRDPEGGAAV